MIKLNELVERFPTKQACADRLNWSRQLLDARLSAKKQVWICEGELKWYIEGGALGEASAQPLLDPEKVIAKGGYGLTFEFSHDDDDWIVDELMGYAPSIGAFRKGSGGAHFSTKMRTLPGQKVPREWLK